MIDRAWKPVGFASFEDVPLHYRPLAEADREVRAVWNDREGLIYFWKPSTDQFWIQIGKVDGRCPTEICEAECCRTGTPWPSSAFSAPSPCPFLAENACAIQQSKFLCCLTAPEPWNGMERLDKCVLRCVEVMPDG